jgi:diadenylate cyclase
MEWTRDLLDVLIVAYVIYTAILLIRGTRAVQMLIGLFVVVLAYFISQAVGLVTLNWLLTNVINYLVLIIIILFQHDIRRALTQFGRNPFFSQGNVEAPAIIEEIVMACVLMANRRIGALVAIERRTGLNNYIEIGVTLDAEITKELLLSIFSPRTPLHDGAVIIQHGRIAAAGAFLPLTVNPEVPKSLGTRHRAALGLTEETDALVIVVSEELGAISVVVEGDILHNLDSTSLRSELQQLLGLRR